MSCIHMQTAFNAISQQTAPYYRPMGHNNSQASICQLHFFKALLDVIKLKFNTHINGPKKVLRTTAEKYGFDLFVPSCTFHMY